MVGMSELYIRLVNAVALFTYFTDSSSVVRSFVSCKRSRCLGLTVSD